MIDKRQNGHQTKTNRTESNGKDIKEDLCAFKYENKYPCFSFARAIDANPLTPRTQWIGNSLNHFGLFSIRFSFCIRIPLQRNSDVRFAKISVDFVLILISTAKYCNFPYYYNSMCARVRRYFTMFAMNKQMLRQSKLSKQIFNWLNWCIQQKRRELRVARFAQFRSAYVLCLKCKMCTNAPKFLVRARHLNCDWICLECSSNNAHLLVNYLSFPLHVSHPANFSGRICSFALSRSFNCAVAFYVSLIFAQPIPCRSFMHFISHSYTYTVHIFSFCM